MKMMHCNLKLFKINVYFILYLFIFKPTQDIVCT